MTLEQTSKHGAIANYHMARLASAEDAELFRAMGNYLLHRAIVRIADERKAEVLLQLGARHAHAPAYRRLLRGIRS